MKEPPTSNGSGNLTRKLGIYLVAALVAFLTVILGSERSSMIIAAQSLLLVAGMLTATIAALTWFQVVQTIALGQHLDISPAKDPTLKMQSRVMLGMILIIKTHALWTVAIFVTVIFVSLAAILTGSGLILGVGSALFILGVDRLVGSWTILQDAVKKLSSQRLGK